MELRDLYRDCMSAVVDTKPGTVDPKGGFPKLFQGLGCVKQLPYKIKLRKDAVPWALSEHSMKDPNFLNGKDQGIDSMFTLGVIEIVDEPTDW